MKNYNKMQLLEKELEKDILDIKRKKAEHNLDRELAQRYKEGDLEAGFELLVSYKDVLSQIYKHPTKTQYRKNVRVYVNWTKEDKENLFQETVLHFYRLIEEYDPSVGNFEGLVKGNLHLRVFRSFVQDLLDNKIKETDDDELEFMQVTDNYLFIDDKVKLPSEHLKLYNALNKLRKREREVILLSTINSWTSQVVGEELGISANTARWHLKKGLDKLREIMKEDEENE